MGWAAAAQAGAQAIDTGLQVWSGMEANASNERIAKQTWTRQKEAMQSRYQWTMEDMRKAGLNPILAYQQGGGTPLSAPTANISPVYQKDGLSSAVSKWREAEQWGQQMKNMEAVEYRDREDAALSSAKHATELENRENAKTLGDIMKWQATSAKAAATGDAIMMDMLEKYPVLRQVDAVSKALQGSIGVGSSARSLLPKAGSVRAPGRAPVAPKRSPIRKGK